MMGKIVVKPNPFTPKSGIEPRVFVNRESEIEFFTGRIQQGKDGQFNHYVINGEWRIGKTALLRYFKLISQQENCYCAYFTAKEFAPSVDDKEISIHLLQSLSKALPIRLEGKSNFIKSIEGFGVKILGTGFDVKLSLDKNKLIDPQVLFLDGLVSIWKDIENKTQLVVVLIDDVQNFSEVPRALTMLKNVLSSEEILKNTKFLFVLSSTVEGWENFIVQNHPIGRYFIPRRELGCFDKENTFQVVTSVLKDTGVKFSNEIIELIWKYSKGHLFEIHSLGSALYDSQINGTVRSAQWDIGFRNGLLYLGDAVFDSRVIGISEKEKEVLEILSYFNEPVLIEDIKREGKRLSIGAKNINQHLRRLVDKRIVQNPQRGFYYIEDKLFCEYLRCKFQ